MSASIVANV
ncbi:ATP-dependent RNA helicase, DEAD/DEAH box family, partial [Vibrio cholerae HC-51A1]